MHEFPHRYVASAASAVEGTVLVSSPDLPPIETSPPPEFGGEAGNWSPETLLVASVANCLVLTFRAVARASKLEWQELDCEVAGKLERLDRVTRFTRFDVTARLRITDAGKQDLARRCLEKAEHGCLVTNSLRAETSLQAEVEVA